MKKNRKALTRISVPTKPLPPLPQELCDMIMDDLSDDIRSLCACGLVCRAWAFSSRRTLFRSVRLTLNNLDKMRIAEFFKLLNRRSSFMREPIRRVEFGLRRSGSSYFKYPIPYSRNLAAVTHLIVGEVELTDDLLLSLSRTFAAIVSLEIKNTSVQNLSNFVSFLSSFTSLEELSIHDVTAMASSVEAPPTQPQQAVLSRKLRSFTTTGTCKQLDALFSAGLPVPAENKTLQGIYGIKNTRSQ